MEASNILHMAGGDGESSYANNSLVQEIVIRKALPVLKEAIKGFANHDVFFGQCFKIADLGCSSGPNTLLSATNIIDIVHEECKNNNRKTPQFQVSLVDLVGNDFNTVLELLPDFYAKLKEDKGKDFGPCFVSAVPGSFYDRLFPNESLHLVTHLTVFTGFLRFVKYPTLPLSITVPEGLENNTSNIFYSKTSPPNVFEAYQKQYASDFTKLLQVRSKEVVSGGRMVLTLIGRSYSDPMIDDCVIPWELLTLSLLDLMNEGLVQESEITSFNMPFYNPCEDEIKTIVENEGSFSLDSITAIRDNWDPYDTDYTNTCASKELSHSHGENTKKMVRAVMEPLLASHFGSSIIEKLFNNFAKHVSESLVIKKARHTNIVISVIKK